MKLSFSANPPPCLRYFAFWKQKSKSSELLSVTDKDLTSRHSDVSLMTNRQSMADMSRVDGEELPLEDPTALSLENCKRRWVKLIQDDPNIQIAVLGGGIYGCHFAHVFMRACEEVSACTCEVIGAKLTLFEKDLTLFSQASGKNSFRIHKGFHYPRSGTTRRMCYVDHAKFCRKYPNFFRAMNDDAKSPAFAKVFAVAKDQKTKLDYEAMRNIFAGAKYQGGKSMWDEIDFELWNEEISCSADASFKRQQMEALGLNVDEIDGAFLVQVEPIMYADEPRKYFTESFAKSPFVELKLGNRVERTDIQECDNGNLLIHQQSFNFALNCTYNQAIPLQPDNHAAFYDICLSVIVAEKSDHGNAPAISFGLFDGPFPSLEPYDFANKEDLPRELHSFKNQNLFQIFDVELSSIGRCYDPKTAYELMENWEGKKKEGSKEYQLVVQKIWDKCEHYYPRLGKDFELAGTWFALKTKVEDENASRPLLLMPDRNVGHHGRFVQVFSSKLTSIFKAEKEFLDLIDSIN
mmetsp:Transcript_12076/g.18174  ORF Transcript_12076/g.18174 Transcript_12076/m.18174 type:complete len:521 (-) Transcript_12076:251-1813(-)|eukprot:CAMPEP_0196807860 /NCGR_PEP_ID=MMETSP1362-20130617/7847_1 /TAXON_ID=163516 /ORGANISM="Leptocylindrus danicus, Strain CCMP1856" /LENGTH=520 /DNA_ID=CAMNT_0042181951 /DNA_START=220 /DNA_END=1785 /DNA_ORIENTATION=-